MESRSAKSASATSWKVTLFSTGMPLDHSLINTRFTEAEYLEIVKGFTPRCMEDKWFLYHEEPFLYIHRSYSGQPVYRVKFEQVGDQYRMNEVLWPWGTDDLSITLGATKDEQVPLMMKLITNLLLERAIEPSISE